MKYIRLLRLPDQYPQFVSVFAAAAYAHVSDWTPLWWGIAVTMLLFAAYIVNELTDRTDSDRYSSNPVHINPRDRFDMRIVVAIIAIFSGLGLFMSYRLGLLPWGVAIWAIGLGYSLKPIRFKNIPVIDLLAQISVWWIPFYAIARAPVFTLVIGLLILSIFYPYQLMDFSADIKAGLGGTHVRLGWRFSLLLGLSAGIVGSILYMYFALYRAAPWSVPALPVVLYEMILYGKWLRLPQQKALVSIDRAVTILKPVSVLFAPYLFVVWRLFP